MVLLGQGQEITYKSVNPSSSELKAHLIFMTDL